MWYEWLIFGVIFLLIPIGIANLKIMAEKKIKPTEEQKKNANLNLGFLMLFYWLCDFFYMAFILDSLTLKFIFGGLIMIVIFMNLSKAFIGGKPQLKWGLVQDFIVGVGMSVYLIYIIPNADLQNVIIPIVSAVYGGLITLVGVAWTIKHTQAEQKKEEISKAKPIFTFNMLYQPIKKVENKKVCFDDATEDLGCKVFFELENSDHSSFTIEKIFHDGKWWNVECNKTMLPNKTIYVEFCFNDDVNNLFIEIKDTLNNSYYYEVKVLCLHLVKEYSKISPWLHTVREIKEISVDVITERTKKL